MLATRINRAPFQAAGSSRTHMRGASVIVAAKPTKAADFRGLDNAEILQKVAELKRENLRLEYMQRTRGNIINPGAVRKHGMDVAMYLFKLLRSQQPQCISGSTQNYGQHSTSSSSSSQ